MTIQDAILAGYYIPNRMGDYEDLIYSTMFRISDEDYEERNDEAVFDAINDELIYYKDQWTVLQEWCTPQEANWDVAIEEFCNDCLTAFEQICQKISEA